VLRRSPRVTTSGKRARSRTGSLGLRGFAVLCATCVACVGVLPGVAQAEIYRWTDDEGRLHFAQDLNRVPAKHRRMAEARANAPAGSREPSRVQTFSPPPAKAGGAAAAASGGSSGGEIHRIRVSKAGSSMRATVLINGRVKVPFILDTGATDVALPSWAAEELGLDLENARTQHYNTANGVVAKAVTTLDSVKLGTAEVRDVPASISTSMSVGLLGLSFFNHFKYDFDPSSGVVTLRENDLAESGTLRGGRSKSQWQAQFRNANARIAHGEKMLDEVPFSRSRKRDQIEEAIVELRRQLELLDGEADDARVPFSWRDE